ncbi:HECT-like ubiquitin-conjugating enzyme-binding-domain-containing protein [Dichotomocladium elegans]|nr:HECT-like ubiquitin-conjugating enzyme-binding-domain-containing protein [Dichotomocladium elegans]
MVLPFFCEELANIKALRAVIAVHPDVSFQENLSIKHNALFLGNERVINFNDIQVTVDPTTITVLPHSQGTDRLIPYEVKLTVVTPKKINDDDDELKTWWPVKDLATKKAFVCRVCDALLVDTASFKFKPLPSEHWYELVECWICHESKPEEHRARMQPISAQPKMLLAGTTYLLVHPGDVAGESIEMDKHAASQLKWAMSRQWIPVHCVKCNGDIGEGQFEKDAEPVLPSFMDFLTFDLLDAVKAHATYRFLIQSRRDSKIQLLVSS